MQEIRFTATRSSGEVSALLERPRDPAALYVLAHGAGAGMRHPFLEELSHRLGERGVACFRYQFPYREQGRKRPDPPAVAQETVRAAVAAARRACPEGVPVVAGGKSWGGRMTAYAAASRPLPGVHGLAFLGFPLHPPRRPGTERWQPMSDVRLPMLFLQGDRDALTDLELLRPLVAHLQPPAVLHVIAGADHSFALPRRLGRSPTDVRAELADVLVTWTAHLPELEDREETAPS